MARHHISRETVRKFLSPVEGGGYGLGPDALSAYCDYAIENQFPDDGDDKLGDQMFPDGNGGFARLMVKTLIPDAFAGPRTVDAVWQNRVNFRRARSRGSTDTHSPEFHGRSRRARGRSGAARRTSSSPTRRAIDSTKSRARRVVMAGGSWTTKHIVSDLPASHRDAYAQFYRSPCLMANIAVRNWRFLYKMGHLRLPLVRRTRQLSLGAQDGARRRTSRAPSIPIRRRCSRSRCCSHSPDCRSPSRAAADAPKLLGTSFAQYERAFREQLGDMFAPGGFDPRRDIAGIILNRWGHAYVNPQPGFFFGLNGKPAPRDVLRNRAARSHRVREYGSGRRIGSSEFDSRGRSRGASSSSAYEAKNHSDHAWRR